jgi:lipoate-protein ligase A
VTPAPHHRLDIGRFDRDEDLLEAARRQHRPGISVYRYPTTSIVLGNGSKPEVELHCQAVLDDGVAVLRRRGGGCAVVLDPGNIVVSVALPLPGLGGIRTSFACISGWLIRGLAEVGVAGITQRGVSDLTIGDTKIGGSCIHRSRDLLYYSTTLLVDPETGLMERYLQLPPREPDYRKGRTHRQFTGALVGPAGVTGADDLVQRLDQVLNIKSLEDQPAEAANSILSE